MHGLINRSLQCFLHDTYGQGSWEAVVREAGLPLNTFEAMLTYEDALTEQVVTAAVAVLGRPRETLLEDLGHYLVSRESQSTLRRLLRFSGVNFVDFVTSLEDLPERARLVLPNLEVPDLDLRDHGKGQFSLLCTAPLLGSGHVIVGLLRAMADDYGALVLLEHRGERNGSEEISIQIADQTFNVPRPFNLGMAVA
ncbi:MAG: heme NO-binding domain-containing protein [bacterium]